MSSLHISDIPVGASVKVRVPATSANLGPGYDSMGLGLGFYDELVVERIESGLEFELSGEGSADVPRDERLLTIRFRILAVWVLRRRLLWRVWLRRAVCCRKSTV